MGPHGLERAGLGIRTAARTGEFGPAKGLLARGADVDAKERWGQTVLM